jgi:hypothetical protein
MGFNVKVALSYAGDGPCLVIKALEEDGLSSLMRSSQPSLRLLV